MIYAFIPARSGSTRLADKNIRPLAGKPLLAWSLEAALESELVDRVIFSSDSGDYVELAQGVVSASKATKPLLIDHRESAHAGTKSKIFDYLKGDLLGKFPFEDKDLLVQLLPTCPLRSAGHVDEAIRLAQRTGKGVFAACAYDFHVSFAFRALAGGAWEPLMNDSPMLTGNTQSQSQVTYLHTNGSINCLPIGLLRDGHSSIYQGCAYFEMDRIDSIDIDDLADFRLAEAILQARSGEAR